MAIMELSMSSYALLCVFFSSYSSSLIMKSTYKHNIINKKINLCLIYDIINVSNIQNKEKI